MKARARRRPTRIPLAGTDAPPDLVIGLGNPGPDHAHHRHNAGFRFLDLLAGHWSAPDFVYRSRLWAAASIARRDEAQVLLLKPRSWMNSSGQAVRAVLDFFKRDATSALIVHDDLDLPPGAARLKRGGGHGGHNGLRDVIRHCGPDFLRLRLGVGHPGDRDRVTPYVLSKPTAGEGKAIDEAMQDALHAFDTLYEKGLQFAMTQLHTPGSEDVPSSPGTSR